jgi:hypothetical protein
MPESVFVVSFEEATRYTAVTLVLLADENDVLAMLQRPLDFLQTILAQEGLFGHVQDEVLTKSHALIHALVRGSLLLVDPHSGEQLPLGFEASLDLTP